jgi:hypothetical protein
LEVVEEKKSWNKGKRKCSQIASSSEKLMAAKEFKEEDSWELETPREDKTISLYIFIQVSGASIKTEHALNASFSYCMSFLGTLNVFSLQTKLQITNGRAGSSLNRYFLSVV